MERALEAQERRNSTTDRLRPAPNITHPVTFHFEIQNHTTRMQKLTNAFKVYRLMVLTLVCVIAGIVIGLLSRPYAKHWTERQFMYIEMPGELYLRFLRLMIIPLLVSNVVLSFGTVRGKISSHLAKVACCLYLMSNLMAITVAIILAVLIRPGGCRISSLSDNRANGLNSLTNQIAKHHQNTADFHDSIARYREYHPMFYHTNQNELPSEEDVAHMVLHSTTTTNSKIDNHSGAGTSAEQGHQEMTMLNESTIDEEAMIDFDQSESNTIGDLYSYLPSAQQTTSTYQDPQILVRARGRVDGSDDGGSFNRNGRSSEQVHSRKDSELIKEITRIGLSTKLAIDVVLDVMRNLVPDSLIGATMQETRTRLFTPKELKINRNGSTDPPPSKWPMGHEMINQPNIIGLLAVSVLTGVVLSNMEEASKPMLDLCSCISELSLRVGMKAINLAPFCIMFLLIGQLARARNLYSMAGELFMYTITVILALLIHGFVLLPLIYYFTIKQMPLKFFRGMLEALVASFATSSSSATMALMLNCLAELDLNLVIVRAFGPLGSVFNMNGTAIFEAVGCIFIAQTLQVTLPLTSLLLVGLCSAVASLSTPGIPSSGMMTLVIVLNAVNLPVLQLSLIYIVDFIIDRFRTVINVWSGALVCALINHICPEDLFEDDGAKPEIYREMVKLRGSRGSLGARKSLTVEEKPQVISVTITPPPTENNSAV